MEPLKPIICKWFKEFLIKLVEYKMYGQDSISEQEKNLACIESRLKNYNTDERGIKLVYTVFSKLNYQSMGTRGRHIHIIQQQNR